MWSTFTSASFSADSKTEDHPWASDEEESDHSTPSSWQNDEQVLHLHILLSSTSCPHFPPSEINWHLKYSATEEQRVKAETMWPLLQQYSMRNKTAEPVSLTKANKRCPPFNVTDKRWFNWIWTSDRRLTYIVQALLIQTHKPHEKLQS